MPSFRELEMQQMSIMHFIRKWRRSADTALTSMPVQPISSPEAETSQQLVLLWLKFTGPDPTVDFQQIFYTKSCAHTMHSYAHTQYYTQHYAQSRQEYS